MKSNIDNEKALEYLFEELSIIYGQVWDKKISNEERLIREKSRWRRVVFKMNRLQLRRALDKIQETPSPFPIYPPTPLAFKDLGHSPHDRMFTGECCFLLPSGKQCRSSISVTEKIVNRVKKMYCSTHLYEIDSTDNKQRDKNLNDIGVNPDDMFAIMMHRKSPSLAKLISKKLGKYTDKQIDSAVEINKKSMV